jgi:ribonuclease-3
MEWAAAHHRKPPDYRVISRSGPDHAPEFFVSASIAHAGEASAHGSSKQEAERAAAAALLAQLLKGQKQS